MDAVLQYRNPRGAGAVLFAILLFSPCAYGRLQSFPSVAKLTEASSTIVVGEVLKVERLGATELPTGDGQHYLGDTMAATIEVVEVLKGKVTHPVIEVDYVQNPDWESGPLTNALSENTRVMLFLKERADKYDFAAPEQASMAMSRDRSALPNLLGPDVYARVIQHLAAPLFSLEDEPQDRVQAIFLIDWEHTQLVMDLYRAALERAPATSDTALRLELLAALVRHKDTSVLPAFSEELFSNHDPVYDNVRSNMILALQQVDAASAEPIFLRAIKLPESGLRTDAIMALKQFPSEAAVDALLDDLDDPDSNTRFQVMEALSFLEHAHTWCPPSGSAESTWGPFLLH